MTDKRKALGTVRELQDQLLRLNAQYGREAVVALNDDGRLDLQEPVKEEKEDFDTVEPKVVDEEKENDNLKELNKKK